MKFISTMVFIATGVIVHAVEPPLDLRVIPVREDALQCSLKNTAQEPLSFSDYFPDNNNYLCSILLSVPQRVVGPLGPQVTYYIEPEKSLLSPSETYKRIVTGREMRAMLSNIYILLHWGLDDRVSKSIFFACTSLSNPLIPPVVADKSTDVEIGLAYVYNKDAPENSELGFLVFNGTNIQVTVTQPLFNDSRLIVTAPSINYSNEVFTVSNTATNAVVEPRAVAEWRIPWQSTYQQLPAPDRAQLEAAGNVDLYWKCGNYVSPVLPVFLKP